MFANDPLRTSDDRVTHATMDDHRGYTAEELERGEDRAWHISIWGCFVLAALLSALAYGLYRFAIWLGVAGSFPL
jgi:hypothetical protein